MTGRVVLITGASGGIGLELAKYMCEDGNDVVLACRSREKGMWAVAKIKEKHPAALVSLMEVDLCNMSSVRDFAADFMKRKRKLHVLINNAGMLQPRGDVTRRTTIDGFEVTMATNYMGHFLLTRLLLDMLRAAGGATGDARIINVSSKLHNYDHKIPNMPRLREVNTEDLMYEREGAYAPMQAYKDSKLCQVLMTYKLAEQLRGSGVTVAAVHPGFLPQTDLNRQTGVVERGCVTCCFRYMLGCTKITRSTRHAAADIATLASSDKYTGVTGKYYDRGLETRSSIESYDVDTQKEVWEVTEKLLGLDTEDTDQVSLHAV